MNEVPASREMDLKLPQNLVVHRRNSNSISARTSAAVVERRDCPCDRLVRQLTHPWDWQPIRRPAPGRCGLERSASACRAENKSVERRVPRVESTHCSREANLGLAQVKRYLN